MARSKLYHVYNGRIRHCCSTCGNKRSFSVPPHIKTRSISCYKCGERERVRLNHRVQPRESQRGKITMTTACGNQIPTNLHDISDRGVGTMVDHSFARTLSVKETVHFKCSWNPRLLTGMFVIRSINGNRVGLQHR